MCHNTRGQSFWKLNSSFLQDQEITHTKNKIDLIITQTKDEYARHIILLSKSIVGNGKTENKGGIHLEGENKEEKNL